MGTAIAPNWIKDKSTAEGFEIFHVKEWDDYKDFVIEPSGYYCLLRIEWDRGKISVAIVNKDHAIEKVFIGRRAQDIYEAIFAYEEEQKKEWFTRKDHIAYLGKELKKAEMCLAIGTDSYFQE